MAPLTVMPVDASRAALLLMDFQPAILQLTGISDADGLLARTANARATARAAGVQVVHVRVAFTDQDYAAIPSNNKAFAAAARAGMLRAGSPDAEIHSALTPTDGDVVVTKARVSAFSTTNLARLLSPRDFDTLILAGISTSGIVLSTVRDAADRDYRIVVLGDCCAHRDREVHRLLLDRVFPEQADVINSTALGALLASA
jgi:nicotinamidase-related amidase